MSTWIERTFAALALVSLWAALVVTWNTYDSVDIIEYRDEYGTLKGTCTNDYTKAMQFLWPEGDTRMICTSSGVGNRMGYRFSSSRQRVLRDFQAHDHWHRGGAE